jgi:iron(III) transport system ATP-binding protein
MLHSRPLSADIAVQTAGLSLAYGPATILNDISLTLPKGQTLALLGPSGCGKTTLLRLVAGLLEPTKGSVTINGVTVADADSRSFIPPEKRHLGMVFQDYALWPHMTVFGNVSFPLEMRGVNRAEREKRVAAALDRVGLSGFGNRSISDMSAPLSRSRDWFCSTNRCPISTVNCAKTWSPKSASWFPISA